MPVVIKFDQSRYIRCFSGNPQLLLFQLVTCEKALEHQSHNFPLINSRSMHSQSWKTFLEQQQSKLLRDTVGGKTERRRWTGSEVSQFEDTKQQVTARSGFNMCRSCIRTGFTRHFLQVTATVCTFSRLLVNALINSAWLSGFQWFGVQLKMRDGCPSV